MAKAKKLTASELRQKIEGGYKPRRLPKLTGKKLKEQVKKWKQG